MRTSLSLPLFLVLLLCANLALAKCPEQPPKVQDEPVPISFGEVKDWPVHRKPPAKVVLDTFAWEVKINEPCQEFLLAIGARAVRLWAVLPLAEVKKNPLLAKLQVPSKLTGIPVTIVGSMSRVPGKVPWELRPVYAVSVTLPRASTAEGSDSL
jgi:hypothetical protein